jgi:two-component system, NarL family, nitrate/nitrite response regulator NarL
MTTMKKIRIILVDDHPLVLEGINSRLQNEDSIEVVGLASNGKEALKIARETEVDVVLMDVNMPVMGGLEATQNFVNEFPDIRVLILSMHDEQEYIIKLMQSGAKGYVLKDVSSDELIKAIETVYAGSSFFSAGASQSLFNGDSQIDYTHEEAAQDNLNTGLSQREETVLKLIAEGQSNKDIARNLDISVRTVETHRQNIKNKLGVHTSAGLIRYAIENKMISL